MKTAVEAAELLGGKKKKKKPPRRMPGTKVWGVQTQLGFLEGGESGGSVLSNFP